MGFLVFPKISQETYFIFINFLVISICVEIYDLTQGKQKISVIDHGWEKLFPRKSTIYNKLAQVKCKWNLLCVGVLSWAHIRSDTRTAHSPISQPIFSYSSRANIIWCFQSQQHTRIMTNHACFDVLLRKFQYGLHSIGPCPHVDAHAFGNYARWRHCEWPKRRELRQKGG